MAPDSFKGTVTAHAAAEALASGWSSVRPQDVVRSAPMADGGEGTIDALDAALPAARRLSTPVTGPGGGERAASWLMLPGNTAVVELAETSGVTLHSSLSPFDAHTIELGRVIIDALDRGAEELVIAVGGSASTDGGAGVLAALGARLLDGEGREVPPGNRGLASLRVADLSGIRPLPPRGAKVLVDVVNPLTGPEGAAAVFGPQKGATPADVSVLERNLSAWSLLVPADPLAIGAGAAGGAAFGLLAWGAGLRPGAQGVADAIGLAELMAEADVVVTGEGSFDVQSAAGKVPVHVGRVATSRGIDVLLVAGSIDASASDFTGSRSLAELAGDPRSACAEPEHWLAVAGASLASAYRI